MKKSKLITIAIFLAFTLSLNAQTNQDSIELLKIASLYSQAWYEGDSLKMSKVLHPELIKRSVLNYEHTGNDIINDLSYNIMMQYTIAGYGKNTPKEKQNDKIELLDIFENIASVRVESTDYVEYIQLVKYNDEWKALNIIWQIRDSKKPK